MFDYKITDDVVHTGKYESTPEMENMLKGAYLTSRKKGTRSIEKLKMLINENPNVPALYNFLYYSYKLNGKTKHAKEVNKELEGKFPDYLFGKIGLAHEHLNNEEYEKIPPLLKREKFDLRELYPNRELFHRSEVRGYHGIVCDYLLKTGDLESAQKHFEYLQEIDRNHEVVRHLSEKLTYQRFLKKTDNYTGYSKRERGVKVGRNAPCSCGSGKKYKRCCGKK